MAIRKTTDGEQGHPMSSFLAFEDAPLTIVDRSTLERFATCPAQAVLAEAHPVASAEAETGEQVHQAYGGIIAEYVESGGALNASELNASELNASELNDVGRGNLLYARPDVQPAAVRGGSRSVWEFTRMLAGINAVNVLRFDGGKGNRSGQLAWDIESMGLRVTSELDLLHSGHSPEVLHEIDFKSGNKFWTADDIWTSFQFQLHAWLVLHNYPEVAALSVRIWNTRINKLTYRVEFTRAHLEQIEARVRSAASAWYDWHGKPTAPAWPIIDKCGMCDVAARCPAACGEAIAIEADPAAYLGRIVATEAALKAMKKAAGAYVEKTGSDIVAGSVGYGFNKPKSKTKPPKAVYKVSVSDDSEDSNESEGSE